MTNTAQIAPPAARTLQEIPVDKIQTDRTQSRAAMDPQAIAEYSRQMKAGDTFPPAIVFHDGLRYWLGDGFHRLAAAKEAECEHLTCEVREGSWRDALKYSLQANQTHGVRRTNADKRHAVELVLADDEWRTLSDRQIAEMCGVSNTLVGTVRAELEQVSTADTSKLIKRTGKDGKQYPSTQPKQPPSPDAEDPNFDYPPDADEFDTVKLEAEAQKKAGPAKPIKSGAEIYPAKLKKGALALYGKLLRTLDEMQISGQLDDELNAILERIEAWGEVDDND